MAPFSSWPLIHRTGGRHSGKVNAHMANAAAMIRSIAMSRRPVWWKGLGKRLSARMQRRVDGMPRRVPVVVEGAHACAAAIRTLFAQEARVDRLVPVYYPSTHAAPGRSQSTAMALCV